MPSTTERSVELLIKDLCDTILIKNDYIDTDAISRYINSLTDKEKSELNNFSSPYCETEVRAITQEKTFEHINSYHGIQNGQTPFDFDIDNNYQNYVDFFVSEYKKGNNYSEPPKIFFCVFRCIKEASENYKLYEKFYQLQESSMEERINALVESRAEKAATTAAKFASGLAVKLADEAADDARQSLKKIKEEEDNIAQNVIEKASTEVTKTVNDLIKEKSVETNLNISSTSVTILGIFAGIVLTIVAGLFYSSSVLESINAASFYKLLCVSALVGMVCMHLITVMFRFIAKLSGKDTLKFFSDIPVIIITVLLAIVIGISFVMQVRSSPDITHPNSDETNVNANMNVNVSNDTTTDTSAEGVTTPESTETEISPEIQDK